MFVEEMRQAWDIMMHPGKATKKTVGVMDGLRYYYKLAIIPLIITVVIGAIVAAVLPGAPSTPPSNPLVGAFSLKYVSGFSIIGGAIGGLLIAAPLGMLIGAAVLQLFGRHLFKIYKNDYEHTFTALAKGSIVPNTLFYWLTAIPVIGMVFSVIFTVWSAIIAVIALANQQGISRWKSLGVLVAIWVVIGIIALLVGAGIAAAFISLH